MSGIRNLVLRWAINAIAIWVAFRYVPGITPTGGSLQTIAVIALIFGLVNAVIRPIIAMLTCPLVILTLGLGTLLINTLMFWLAGLIGEQFGYGFRVAGFWPAFWGALVVTAVSIVLSALLGERSRRSEYD